MVTEFLHLQRQINDAPLDCIGDAVPDAIRPGWLIGQRLWPACEVAVIPSIEGLTRDAEAGEAAALVQVCLLDQLNDFEFFGGVRCLAQRIKGASQAHHLLALAAIHDGVQRPAAAWLGDVTPQIIWDWMVRFNIEGPEGPREWVRAHLSIEVGIISSTREEGYA